MQMLWCTMCIAHTARAAPSMAVTHQKWRPCTARYVLDQVPTEEFPSTPLPNALISPLPQEHVPLQTLGDLLRWGWEVVHLP